MNITAPRPLEPYAGSTLVFNSEPPTLLIENAGTSGARAIWLRFEVARDWSVQPIVCRADEISLGGGGRTSYRLPAPLGAGYTYTGARARPTAPTSVPSSSVSNFGVVRRS